MTRFFYTLFCVALSFFIAAGAGHAAAWEGKVVKVIDGDSLKVQRRGKLYEIRLYGIDTPEYRQPYSNKAKQFTRRLAFGEMASVEEKDTDRYGRIVALVTIRGKMVNRELVREGLAWYYPKYCRAQPLCGELRQLEERAKKQRRGFWQDSNPIPPWQWKRQQKSGGVSKGKTGWYYRLLDRL